MTENRLAADLNHVLDHTRELWEELRGERIFITGGTGFFGCWLLESFAWANDRLGLNASALVLTRNLDAFRQKAPHLASHPAIRFHVGDVRDFEFPTGTFSHVIHAASESSANLDETKLLEMLDVIVTGTRHTLEFAQQRNAQKLLFTSSGAIYGNQAPRITPIREDEPFTWLPRTNSTLQTIYREGKLLSELQCEIFARAYGISAKIARCFAFIGPYQPLNSHFAVGNFIRDGLKGGPIQINGDGTPYRSYLYGADLAIWLWTIFSLGRTGRPYNVGSDEEINIFSLAKKVAELIDGQPEVKVAISADLQKIPERYIPSIQRAREELKLQIWVDLEQALRKTINWYSENGW